MRALDDTLRGLPPAPAGKGNGRTGGALAGAFEDAVANAGREKNLPGTGNGFGDAVAGDDAGAEALIDKDNISKTVGRHAHAAAARSIAISRDEQALGEQAAGDHFPATERGVGGRRDHAAAPLRARAPNTNSSV